MPKRPWLPRQSAVVDRDERGWLRWWWWGPSDFDIGIDGLVGAVLGVIVTVLVVTALFSVIFPLIALTLELIVFVIVATAGVIGRVVFGRPWRIEAATIGRPRLTREVQARGLRGSREAIEELALAIQSGH
jgi:hypothetical protein